MLRYRLRAEQGARPSSLAHTGEPLREPGPRDAIGRQDAPDGGHNSALAAACAGGGGAAAAACGVGATCRRPSWVEQFPSDFAFYQNLVRAGVGAGTAAARPGIATARRSGAADGDAGPTPPQSAAAAAGGMSGRLTVSDGPLCLNQALLLPPTVAAAVRREGDWAGFDVAGAIGGRCGPAAGGSGQWLPAGGAKADLQVAMHWQA